MRVPLTRLSPACFAAAALFFFLPFFNVSCQGKPLGRLTGLETMTGKKVDLPQAFGGARFGRDELKGLTLRAAPDGSGVTLEPGQRVGGSPLGGLSFACALFGVAVFFLPRARASAAAAARGLAPAAAGALAGAAGAALLFVNKAQLASRLQEPTMGLAQVDAAYGFWLAAAAFAAAALVNLRAALAPAADARASVASCGAWRDRTGRGARASSRPSG